LWWRPKKIFSNGNKLNLQKVHKMQLAQKRLFF
jgi:hypothetical protein